ncbi:ABC-type Na+ efflux pump permease subunit [Scopulibacillus daqui]|uniref:ABC-type Na+ efflux pump permease subunit n=1 Tax=Scopulibacillus daqui TaxID=1469162 RepID=A0ABS2Q3P1_9BACL|nr:hypothetical protein [Scopulibacillus daqui]MBM7646918.1 ABC-type Na+ efflux pump permease subunit [Scopulibacillus daqui]
MNKFWIVFSHTYGSKCKSKSFISATLIMMVLTVVLISMPKITSYFNGHHVEKVAVIDRTRQLFEPLNSKIKKVNKDIKLTPFKEGENQAKKRLKMENSKDILL